MKKQTEEKQAAASYILTFYNDVQQITHAYAEYENFMLELESKSKDISKIDEEIRQTLIQICHTLRYHTNISYIKYMSIISKLNDKPNKTIQNSYNKIKSELVIKREDINTFVIEMNSVLMETVIKNLLENSTEIINNIYGENE